MIVVCNTWEITFLKKNVDLDVACVCIVRVQKVICVSSVCLVYSKS